MRATGPRRQCSGQRGGLSGSSHGAGSGAVLVTVDAGVDGAGVDGARVDGAGVDGAGVDGAGVDAAGTDGSAVGETGADAGAGAGVALTG